MAHSETILRELHHRVKNNLQVIVSLMSLKTKLLPPERRADIRFLREHVQAMAGVYRLAYRGHEASDLMIGDLLTEVVAEIRQVCELDSAQVHVTGGELRESVDLDFGMGISMYLAAVLPPYMDSVKFRNGDLSIRAWIEGKNLYLSVFGGLALPIELDVLNKRLSDAYASQLKAAVHPPSDTANIQLCFPIK